MAKFRSQLEASTGMYVVLSEDGSQRIPFGRTHDAKQQAEQTASLLSGDWEALRFAGVELPAEGS